MSDILTEPWQGLPALPLAEEMDPELLIRNGELIARHEYRNKLNHRYAATCNTLEVGLCTRDFQLVDSAFETFHELSEQTEEVRNGLSFFRVCRMVAFERGFRQRLIADPLSRKGINEIYRGVGSLAANLVESKNWAPNRRWAISCTLVDGALVRTKDPKLLPLPASLREEYARDASKASHHSYLIKREEDGTRKKDPYAVVVRTPSKKAKEIDQFGDMKDRHPSIHVIPALTLLSATLVSYPELESQIFGSNIFVKEQIMRQTGEFMHRESQGEDIGEPGKSFLNSFSKLVKAQIIPAAKHGPLTNNLGDQLRRAGFTLDNS